MKQNINLKSVGQWKNYESSTKRFSCRYQAQRPSPIFTSKAVLIKVEKGAEKAPDIDITRGMESAPNP